MPARKRRRKASAAADAIINPTPVPDHSHPAAWHVADTPTIGALVDEIFDPTRYAPLVLVTVASDTRAARVAIPALVEAVAGAARIAYVTETAASRELSARLPDRFRTYGGATRIFWPYATPDDPEERHPMFLTLDEANSPKTVHNIRKHLLKHGYLHPEVTSPEVTSPEPTKSSQPSPRPWQDCATGTEDQHAEIDRLTRDLAAATDRAARATAEAQDLRRQLKSVTDQNTELTRRLHARDLYTDPARQFAHEVDTAWLHQVPEGEREQYPLRPYTFGPDFLASLDIEGIDRDKIVATVVDVLTRRVWEMTAGRHAHQFRVSEAGNSPARTREDGSVAWRCNLQANSPSARRLMWWEIATDGSVELAKVAIHDDYDLT